MTAILEEVRQGSVLQRAQRRVYEIVSLKQPDDHWSKLFHLIIMSLICLNALAVTAETVEPLAKRWATAFFAFEVASVAVFTVEYVLRVWSCTCDPRFASPLLGRLRYAMSPMAIVDLLAILPFYLPMVLPLDLRILRVLRLFRLFRVLKLSRYSQSLRTIGIVLSAKKEDLIVTFFAMMLLLILASSLMYVIERDAQPEAFSSIPASMWWAVVTLTTVGYGDVYPATPLGKLIGALIALLGVGMVALPAGMLASGFAEELQRRKRQPTCPHCGERLDTAPRERIEQDG